MAKKQPIRTETPAPEWARRELPGGYKHAVGYARVSMSDQNCQRQVDELVRFGVSPLDIFKDNASGKTMKRPGWEALWKDIQEGDLLVVLSVDRLGRNLVQVVQTVEELTRLGVGLKVLNGEIDTTTPSGRLMLAMLAAMAQWERELIEERTRHGLEKARKRGVIGGRPIKLTQAKVDEAIQRANAGEPRDKIATAFGVHRNTLTRAMDRRRAELRRKEVEDND